MHPVTYFVTYFFQVCFAYNEDTLTIVDVTDKNNMFFISRTGYDGASYSHQVTNTKTNFIFWCFENIIVFTQMTLCQDFDTMPRMDWTVFFDLPSGHDAKFVACASKF